ncbi:transcription factor Adf-1-like [Macrosteles quadrilineatus]|uniref:transcription factor Adf-1-like n=1 Tax=Macrosteles quadrilineatus TaxID=74068 RepID=UPI0023E27516|nr:transcription factor Adf-1-like [Macrosteles quadrilineatus]
MSRCADVELIEAVRLYEHLYNSSDRNYHDAFMKENAWSEIASIVNSSVTECKKKWFSIRDSYRKSLKKQRISSGQANPTKPYRYADLMSFLKPFISEREPKYNSVLLENSEDHELEDPSNEPAELDAEVSTVKDFKQESIIDHKERSLPIYSSLNSYLQKKIDRQDNRAKKDHLTKFFEAMEATVRTFNPLLQVEVKSKISSLVSEYELENLRAESSLLQASHHSPS